jgi:tol-pal system protein YbgF
MLERQVYRGAPTASPSAAPGSGGANAADVEIRMERLEAQMRDLTGRVEEVANGVEQLKQRIEQINSDFDVRVGELSGAGSAGAPAVRPVGPPPRGDGGRFAGPGPAVAPGSVVPPPSSGGLSPIFNTLTPPGAGPAAPASPPPPAAEPASAAGGLPRGSVNQQFNYAFGLVKQADYAGAEAALKAFLAAHPNEPLAANAQYWLGQTYYQRNKYAEAASAFAEGYKRYPKGTKAPENLLYLGMSLARADQKKNACIALTQLDEAFPTAGAPIKQRATAERKRLGCG